MTIILAIPIVFISLHLVYIACGLLYLRTRRRELKQKGRPRTYAIEHIVCFKNESTFVRRKLENAYSLSTRHDIHHTFVNDNSEDDTLSLLEQHAGENTRIINNTTNYGKNGSQIRAVNASESDLLLFTDANVFLNSEAVEALVTGFDQDTGGVTGNVKITTDLTHQDFSGRYWEIEKRIKEFQTLFGTVIGFDGGFYCIKRENYYLKRENELSDFESAFLILENGKKTRYVSDAEVVELERRTLRNSFKSRMRASNRVFWSFGRISKYAPRLKPMVLLHFFFHKIARYCASLSLILALPFAVPAMVRYAPVLLVLFLLPWVWRILMECAALTFGGVVALSGKEYTTWSHTKS